VKAPETKGTVWDFFNQKYNSKKTLFFWFNLQFLTFHSKRSSIRKRSVNFLFDSELHVFKQDNWKQLAVKWKMGKVMPFSNVVFVYNNPKISRPSGGQRLVGASKGDTKTIPFVVAWNAMPNGPRPNIACTGVYETKKTTFPGLFLPADVA